MPDKAKDIKRTGCQTEIVELNQYDINVIKRAIETDMNVSDP